MGNKIMVCEVCGVNKNVKKTLMNRNVYGNEYSWLCNTCLERHLMFANM